MLLHHKQIQYFIPSQQVYIFSYLQQIMILYIHPVNIDDWFLPMSIVFKYILSFTIQKSIHSLTFNCQFSVHPE